MGMIREVKEPMLNRLKYIHIDEVMMKMFGQMMEQEEENLEKGLSTRW